MLLNSLLSHHCIMQLKGKMFYLFLMCKECSSLLLIQRDKLCLTAVNSQFAIVSSQCVLNLAPSGKETTYTMGSLLFQNTWTWDFSPYKSEKLKLKVKKHMYIRM